MGRQAQKRKGMSSGEIRAIRKRRRILEQDASRTAESVKQAIIGSAEATDLPAHLMGLNLVLAANAARGVAFRCWEGQGEPSVTFTRDINAALSARINELILGFAPEDLEDFRAREAEGKAERADSDTVPSAPEKGQASEANTNPKENDVSESTKRPADEPTPPEKKEEVAEEDTPVDPAERLDERVRDVDEQPDNQ